MRECLCHRLAVALLVLSGIGTWGPRARAQVSQPSPPEGSVPSSAGDDGMSRRAEPSLGPPTAAGATVESLGPEQRMARGVLQFEGGRYDECIEQLEPLVGTGSSTKDAATEIVDRARVYLTACYLGRGDSERANATMELAIRANPQLRPPDLLVFPQAVVDVYLQVRQRLLDEIRRSEQQALQQAQREAAETVRNAALERARVAELELLAMEELVVVRNRRWVAALPYGVGQFQNGDSTLGWVLFGSEVALTGTVVGALITDRVLAGKDSKGDPVRAQSLLTARQGAYDVLVYASWGLLAVAAGGITEAQISFVSETNESRRRPLPERLRRVIVAPQVSQTALGLGLFGAF
jgi:hypothetical protein